MYVSMYVSVGTLSEECECCNDFVLFASIWITSANKHVFSVIMISDRDKAIIHFFLSSTVYHKRSSYHKTSMLDMYDISKCYWSPEHDNSSFMTCVYSKIELLSIRSYMCM